MVTSQVTSESLGLPPSTGSWLLAGKSSRKSHSKEKEGLFGEETLYKQCGASQRVSVAPGYGVVTFWGMRWGFPGSLLVHGSGLLALYGQSACGCIMEHAVSVY